MVATRFGVKRLTKKHRTIKDKSSSKTTPFRFHRSAIYNNSFLSAYLLYDVYIDLKIWFLLKKKKQQAGIVRIHIYVHVAGCVALSVVMSCKRYRNRSPIPVHSFVKTW